MPLKGFNIDFDAFIKTIIRFIYLAISIPIRYLNNLPTPIKVTIWVIFFLISFFIVISIIIHYKRNREYYLSGRV